MLHIKILENKKTYEGQYIEYYYIVYVEVPHMEGRGVDIRLIF